MDKNRDYKIKDAYKNLREWVQLLGDEIREIRDVDHDELEEWNKKRGYNFNFHIDEIRKRLKNVEFHYKILEALQTLSNLQHEGP